MEWSSKTISINEVEDWVNRKLKNTSGNYELFEVYRSNDWAITAKFSNQKQSVVCKIGFLPIFQYSPFIYQLLSGSTNQVPIMIDYEIKGKQTWMIFEEFKGTSVKEMQSLTAFQNMAKSLAKIQLKVSDTIEKESFDGIPRVPVSDIPKLYEALLEDIEQKYAPVWQKNSLQISEKYGLELTKIKKLGNVDYLKSFMEDVIRWSKCLAEAEYLATIYHIDLHSGNAVEQPDGKILIYDWEEGTISHPFFSLEKLLEDTYQWDRNKDKVVFGPLGLEYSLAQVSVRDSYLSVFSGEAQEHCTYFDLARCLAPIKYIYQSQFFLKQVGWDELAPELIAIDLLKAINRWEKVKDKTRKEMT